MELFQWRSFYHWSSNLQVVLAILAKYFERQLSTEPPTWRLKSPTKDARSNDDFVQWKIECRAQLSLHKILWAAQKSSSMKKCSNDIRIEVKIFLKISNILPEFLISYFCQFAKYRPECHLYRFQQHQLCAIDHFS